MALRVQAYLGLDGTAFQQGMNRANATVNRFSRSFTGGITSRFAALFSVGAIGIAIKKTVDYGSSLIDLSNRSGVAVESLQRMGQAAKENGSSIESLVGFFEKLNVARSKALKNPKGEEAKSFEKFSVTGQDLKSSSAEDITRKISVAFQNTTNVEALVAPLREIGGRGAGELISAFVEGLDAGYQSMQVITTEQAQVLDELQDKAQGLWQVVMANVAPALIWLIDGFYGLIESWKMLKVFSGSLGAFVVQVFSDIFTSIVESFQEFITRLKKMDIVGAVAAISGVSGTIVEKTKKNLAQQQEEVFEGLLKIAEEEKLRKSMEAARREARNKPKTTLGFDADEISKPEKGTKLYTDSLTGVGNFLGAGASGIQAVSERQLQTQQSILAAIKTSNALLAKKTSEANIFPQ